MIKLNPILCEEANRIRTTLIHFGHAVLGPWWKGKDVTLNCSQLYYIVKGSAKFVFNDNEILIMEEGNWYLLPSGLSVTYCCDDFMEEIYFHLKLCNIDWIDLLKNYPKPLQLPIKEDMTDFFLSLLNSNNSLDGYRLKQTIDSVLLSFIDNYNIEFKSKKLSPYISKALVYISNNLSMQLTVSEIVKNTFVSKSTLEAHFKQELGTSIHKYLLNTVMFEASQMLLKTNLSICAISERFGFCDQFHFSKQFKESFGKSPKEFRKSPPM